MFGLIKQVLPPKAPRRAGRFGTPKTADDILRMYSEMSMSCAEHAHQLMLTAHEGHDTQYALEDLNRSISEWETHAPVIDSGALEEVDCRAQDAWTPAALKDYIHRCTAASAQIDSLGDKIAHARDHYLSDQKSHDAIRAPVGVVQDRVLKNSVEALRNVTDWASQAHAVMTEPASE